MKYKIGDFVIIGMDGVDFQIGDIIEIYGIAEKHNLYFFRLLNEGKLGRMVMDEDILRPITKLEKALL